MDKYEHRQQFDVKYCDVDFKDEVKPSTVLAYLEEVACNSADELGFGYKFIRPKNLAFIVTNVQCAFHKPLPLGEKLDVVTWPLPPAHVTFGREYQIFSPTGEKYMDASSRWCLIDFTTGRIQSSKVIEGQDYSTYNTTRALEVESWKLPIFSLEEGEFGFEMTVRNSEYDHNMHVNNTRYADYCFNCFGVEQLRERSLNFFAITYVRQCRENDRLRFFKKCVGEESYLIQGVNAQDEIVVQAKIGFSKNA